MFEPGQLVLCVDDSPGRRPHALRRGRIYTIACTVPADDYGDTGVDLVELPAPIRRIDPTLAYRASRFSPLPEERLEVFRQMLAPTELERREFISEDIADDMVEVERGKTYTPATWRL